MDKDELNEIAKMLGEPGPNEELFFARRRALGLGAGLDENGEIVSVGGPVFIDFEASSLSQDSWPIEVGVAWLNETKVVIESKLIQPRPDWLESDWNAESQNVHGIQRSELDDASPPDDVAKWLLETVGGRPLFSDAPKFDQRWLNRLLNQPSPEISDFEGAVPEGISKPSNAIDLERGIKEMLSQEHQERFDVIVLDVEAPNKTKKSGEQQP
ncbi:3'-5' exonuclease [Halocynthiibacter styelae]|uniref:Uncharacterized protein n=1 Tax=Halocynthiibacter styelae TaxID=2761955 RepID=A0A8J7IQM9_9RHOB|nr:hypothetical protein [Paenihalocynthiibacter styelae]MBI1495271.1 hypothetical protein [Paenihalocynthiibacter styelae]